MTTPRARSSTKFRPSESFAPMTAKRRAPFFPSVGFETWLGQLGRLFQCLPLSPRQHNLVGLYQLQSCPLVQNIPEVSLKKEKRKERPEHCVPASWTQTYPTAHSSSKSLLKSSKTCMMGKIQSSRLESCSRS